MSSKFGNDDINMNELIEEVTSIFYKGNEVFDINHSNSVSSIEIDLAQFRKNMQQIRSYLPPTVRICFPVKADAYGHGIIRMAKSANELVDYFAVALVQEGILLREAGINKPILVLGGIDPNQMEAAISYNLHMTVSSIYKAKCIAMAAEKQKKKALVHIKVDTGMQRVGVRPESLPMLYEQIQLFPQMVVKGLYSHLATSNLPCDPFAENQINLFHDLVADFKALYPEAVCHLSNSGGLCYYSNSFFDMIRPGILSLGYAPSNLSVLPSKLAEIKPFYRVKSKVSYFKVLMPNTGIGYGHTYTTKKQTRIATIAFGYGDGLPRNLGNIGHVLIRGRRYPIVGAVCMDSCMVDLGCDGEAYVGDEVIFIGGQGSEYISLQIVAEQCQTIIYDILCRFNARVPKIYYQ